MESRDIRLLENTAIRYVSSMDYRTRRELDSAGITDNDYPVISDIKDIIKSRNGTDLSSRARGILEQVIKDEYKIRKAVDDYADIVCRENIKIVCKSDRDYPFSWIQLTGMPPLFFAKGDTSILSSITLKGAAAIVGSRKPGRYSLYATREFSGELSKKNVAVVSGLALGIDRAAHEACLDAGGKTVAVTAGGADIIYPYQNRDVYDRIVEEGVLITELPPGQSVLRQYFPSRNRLISALSDSCLIMEAGLYSGTLHTASFAASQGKDVFVLPNSIYSDNSIGGLMLIRDGAEVLIDVDTVYERIMGEVDNRRLLTGFDEDHAGEDPVNRADYIKNLAQEDPGKVSEEQWKILICDKISERPLNIDELCISLGIPFSYLSSMVIGLETEGRIVSDKGKYVLTISGR